MAAVHRNQHKNCTETTETLSMHRGIWKVAEPNKKKRRWTKSILFDVSKEVNIKKREKKEEDDDDEEGTWNQ